MSISTKTANPPRSKRLSKGGKPMIPVLLALAMLVAGVNNVRAEGVDLKDTPHVKMYPVPETFEKDTQIIREIDPYGESLMSYEFRVPKGWGANYQSKSMSTVGESVSTMSNSVLSILGRYAGVPKNQLRSHILVEGQGLAYEISAKNWFVNFVLINGFSLTSMTEVSPREVDGLYIEVDKDQTYAVRARVLINGNRLIMMRYYLPQENYNDEKVTQGLTVASFKLSKPVPDTIEKQETYGFLDQSFFNYPASWTLKEKSILSIERMHAVVFQATQQEESVVLDGHIRVDVISKLLKTTLAQEIDAFRAKQKIPRYKIGSLIGSIEYTFDPSVKSGKAQIYRLVPDDPVNMKDYEFAVTVMQGDDYYYITSMISPSREQDYSKWARNMESYRIINQSVRRSRDMLQFDPNDPYFDYLKEYEEPQP